MDISPEEIHRKKRELGLEPSQPGHGPEEDERLLAVKNESEAALSEQAGRVESQQGRSLEGSNQHNQYRYGGHRP